ncbi:MAG: maleylpyruvate isomerase family mycothiol-dependent enzyme [Caldilineaceae bacterium]|nr:maleylpyruvate isomerase family mycothiol-dependent enzyme [Caldilineaceae bacterium]
MNLVTPLNTVELFPELSQQLLSILTPLPRAAWAKETACAGWSVHDVTAHLLGGNLSRLSFGRDRLVFANRSPFPADYREQVAYIDQRNAEWVNAARQISPPLLLEFLASTDVQLYHYFQSLPLDDNGIGVTWAGEQQSPNWFDIAREYTEKWLHQQHIREAVGQPLLTQRQWLFPVLDTFMRALPHAYRAVTAPSGTTIGFHITGAAGGTWVLLRQAEQWHLGYGTTSAAAAMVQLDQDLAWRLFTKGIAPAVAREQLQVEGDATLGWPILTMVSIMA